MAALLSIADARAAVLRCSSPLPTEDVAIAAALDRVLARDLTSQADVPPFDGSAMDGFALRSGPAGRRLRIVAESRAGAPAPRGLEADDEAVRISTGAAVPPGADAVVMVEHTTEEPDAATVTVHAATEPDQNLRRAGTDMAAGTVVLTAGTRLGPAELGVAASAGAAALRCARRPRVAVLSTGDELVPHGLPLGPGQIHDSNGVTLAALAHRAGAEVVRVGHLDDEPEATRLGIAEALLQADVLLLSGGVSVGPHDHVKPALLAAGVREVFWRIALRPGKPTWFGTTDATVPTLAFGLPGNPVSAMVTFLLFVRPALARLQGADPRVPRLTATTTQDLPRHPGRDELVRVRLDAGRATPTGPQGSHVLTSMLGADGLAVVLRGDGVLPAGSTVDVEPV